MYKVNQKIKATADPAGIMGFKRCREAESKHRHGDLIEFAVRSDRR